MSSQPHRISLARGWTFQDQMWQRVFHAPSLPSAGYQVRLCLQPAEGTSLSLEHHVQLNHVVLTWSLAPLRLECMITELLQANNRIMVLLSHDSGIPRESAMPHDSASGIRRFTEPPFQAYLEILEPV